MELREQLKMLKQKEFVKYSDMAKMVNVLPTSFYQYLYGNATLAKGKQDKLQDFVDNYYKKVF